MVLLAADIGNAHTVLGLLQPAAEGPGHDVLAHWRVGTDERRTADEWAVLLRGLLGRQSSEIEGLAVCSTVPSVLHEWRDMLGSHFDDVPRVVVEPGVRTGIPVLMDNPREVGSDRIINALAVATLHSGPAVVVDFGGTATTFDVVSAQGQYVGGAIAPGIEISLEALQSGMVFGAAAQVEGLVHRMVAELGVRADDMTVVATGHLAPLVLEECSVFTVHDPWLTLRGLGLVYDRNR